MFLARYRALAAGALSMLLTLPAAAAVAPQEGAEIPGPVRLNAASIDKIADVMNGLVDAVRADPAVLDELPSPGSEQETLGDWEKRIQSSPRISAIFRNARTTPREYIVSLLSLAQAQAYSVASKAGRAPRGQDPVVLANAKLVETHPAEMRRVAEAGARLQALDEEGSGSGAGGIEAEEKTPEPSGKMRGGPRAGAPEEGGKAPVKEPPSKGGTPTGG